jgi:hypothetical protein
MHSNTLLTMADLVAVFRIENVPAFFSNAAPRALQQKPALLAGANTEMSRSFHGEAADAVVAYTVYKPTCSWMPPLLAALRGTAVAKQILAL